MKPYSQKSLFGAVSVSCLALLTCCGPGTRKQPKSVTPVIAEPVRPVRVAGVTPAPPAETPAPHGGAVTGGPQSVWMETPSVFGKIVFDDELIPVTEAVAERLPPVLEGKIQMVPPSELRRIQKDIRGGRLPERAETCPSPPPPLALLDYLHQDAGNVDVRIDCEQECVVTAVWWSPKQEGEDGRRARTEIARYQMTLPKDTTALAWAETIRSQTFEKVPSPEPSGGLGILRGRLATGKGKKGYEIYVEDVVQEGPWEQTLNSDLFRPRVAKLHQCTKGKGRARDWWLQPYLIEVSPAGKVTRCESQFQHRLDPPEFACRCKEIEKMRFGRAKGVRRARFNLSTSHSREVQAALFPAVRRWVSKELRADDESVLLGSGAMDEECLRRCTDAISEASEIAFSFSADVKGDGTVTHVQGDFPATIDTPMRRCFSDVLFRSQFNCPLSGSARVEGEISIHIQYR